LKAVADVHLIDQHEIHVTTSIGVSVYPSEAKNAVALIKNADTAMYHAKKKGRQMYEVFRPDMLFDPIDPRSNEVEPIVGQGSRGFNFRTKYFPLIRGRGPL
jgi:predicted signal transduction protein with EAL and GGDEF domain